MKEKIGITSVSRVGMRRVVPAWEFRHLRVWAGARIGGGAVLTVCGVLTLSFGGHNAKTFGWAAAFLTGAALSFAAGCREWTIDPHGTDPA